MLNGGGVQLNKIKEAREFDKDIFSQGRHNHHKVLEAIKAKTKENQTIQVLKTLHEDGNIKHYEYWSMLTNLKT